MIKRIESLNPDLLSDIGERVYSYSSLATYQECPMSWKFRYIDRLPSKDNGWSVGGSIMHDALEDHVLKGQVDYNIYEKIVTEFSKQDVDIPVGRENWHKNMMNISKNFSSAIDFLKDYKVKDVEKEFLIKLVFDDGNHMYLRGFIDLILEKDSKTYIYDWKTSSLYSGKDKEKHMLQLLLYQSALKSEGIETDYLGWIFLKYLDIKVGDNRYRRSQRKDWLRDNESRLEEVGLERDHIQELEITDVFNSIPEEFKDEVLIKQHIQKSNTSKQELIRLLHWVEDTHKEILNSKKNDDWQIKDNAPDFFCDKLCDYSQICPAYKEEPMRKRDGKIDKPLSEETRKMLSEIFDV